MYKYLFMAKIETEEIKEFLRNKPGYLKEGGKRLKALLESKGFTSSIKRCKQAIREVTSEQKELDDKLKSDTAKILFYDIETSFNEGWFWRPGRKISIPHSNITKERAIICVSYKWAGEDEVYTLSWDACQSDKFLIDQFVNVLNEADLIVAHNGNSFDIRWIRGRAAMHRVPMLPRYKQYDTMRVAMKQFNLNSYALTYIAKLFDVGCDKIRTRPDLWEDVCLHNDRTALVEMIEYCEQDVVVLEKVYDVIKMYDNPMIHAGTLNNKIKVTSPINGGVNIKHIKTTSTVAGTLKHVCQDLETGRYFEMSDTNYKKFLTINK